MAGANQQVKQKNRRWSSNKPRQMPEKRIARTYRIARIARTPRISRAPRTSIIYRLTPHSNENSFRNKQQEKTTITTTKEKEGGRRNLWLRRSNATETLRKGYKSEAGVP